MPGSILWDCSRKGTNKSLSIPQSKKAPISFTSLTSKKANDSATASGVVVVAMSRSEESLKTKTDKTSPIFVPLGTHFVGINISTSPSRK